MEYLNLPENSRQYLVRKRYLELKRDYLKAIYNAPSEHFSNLYRENLQKIEEAYSLLNEKKEGVNERNPDIPKTIKQIQQVVDTFLEEKGTLDTESRQKLKEYISQIDQLKDSLKGQELQKPSGVSIDSTKQKKNQLSSIVSKTGSVKPDSTASGSQNAYQSDFPGDNVTGHQEENEFVNHEDKTQKPGWKWDVKNFKTKISSDKQSQRSLYTIKNMNLSIPGIVKNWVDKIIENPYATSSGGRKHLFDQFLMGVILIIAILGVLGVVYVMFPLFFSN